MGRTERGIVRMGKKGEGERGGISELGLVNWSILKPI
jgi:hypothetical protein